MDKTFSFKIKTPEKRIYEGEVSSVTLLTENGTIYLGPKHAGLASSILETTIEVVIGKEKKQFIGRDGFVFFNNEHNEATVLLLWAELIEEVEEQSIGEYLSMINKEIDEGIISPLHAKYADRQRLASEKLVKIVKEK